MNKRKTSNIPIIIYQQRKDDGDCLMKMLRPHRMDIVGGVGVGRGRRCSLMSIHPGYYKKGSPYSKIVFFRVKIHEKWK
jgi:hypothetical protein